MKNFLKGFASGILFLIVAKAFCILLKDNEDCLQKKNAIPETDEKEWQEEEDMLDSEKYTPPFNFDVEE